MDKKTRFWVSRKNPMTWLMALCMLASSVVRVIFACMRGIGDSGSLWGLVVLPTAACLLFALICLLNGKERYYKTAIPIYMMALYLCFYTRVSHPQMDNWFLFLYYFLFFTLATVYALTVAGRFQHFWILLFVYLVPLLARTVDNWSVLTVSFVRDSVLELIPDSLFLLGLILGVFATWIQNDGKYHPTWGDRADGRRLRTLYPISQITPYIMPNRNGSNNLFSNTVEITNLDRFIRMRRREGMTNLGITHVILAAYARTVAKYPGLNRFLAGQKIYSRGDDIQICMTIKKEMTVEAPDSVIKLHLTPADTLEDVYNKFNILVEEVKNAPLNSDLDNLIRGFTMIPGVFLKFAVWLLKVMDYFGLIPASLTELSPFHASLFVTSIGSLGIPAIFHHLYDFGNLPVFCAFGCKRKSNEVSSEGEILQKKYIDLNFTLDERIVDGFYYATAIKYMNRLLQHPQFLEQPPETIVQDIE